MRTLATIEKLYNAPQGNDSPRTTYSASAQYRDGMRATRDELQRIIEEHRTALGVAHVRPLNLDKIQAEQLRSAIRSDPAWQERFFSLVELCAPDMKDISKETQLGAITLPWWNAAVLSRRSSGYDERTQTATLDADVSHSYITQLLRSPEIFQAHGKPAERKADPLSVSNALITRDGLVVFGLRGGHAFSNTIMSMPAGSVEYHTGQNPVLETLYAEHFEETGLGKEHLVSVELLGTMRENAMSKTSYFIFRTTTDLTFAQLHQLWSSAIDNREHKYLIPILDDPDEMLRFVQMNRFDPEKLNPASTMLTTMENVNAVLPPCVATLLMHYAHREGKLWGKKVEGLLNGAYAFD